MNLSKVVKDLREQLAAMSGDRVSEVLRDADALLVQVSAVKAVLEEGKEVLHRQIPGVLLDTRATLRELEQRVTALEKRIE